MSINWDAMGAMSELVAAVAVVVTLIYLAAQIRQNNRLLGSGSRQALVANDVTSLTANIQNAETFARCLSRQALSQEDQLRMSFMFALDLRNASSNTSSTSTDCSMKQRGCPIEK
jgi:hypothetical protein